MNDREVSDIALSSDALFEAQLRQAMPAASSISIEDMMYRAGYEAGRKQSEGLRFRWSGFGWGACSGALAAGWLWFCIALPFSNREPSMESGLNSIAASNTDVPAPAAEETTGGALSMPIGSQGSERLSPPANPFIRRGNADLDRDSLNEVAKRQWDRRRLSERTQWISARAANESHSNADTPDSIPPSSLWQIRNGSVPMLGL